MPGPRDAPPEFGVPVNPDTLLRLSESARHHGAKIREAEAVMLEALHNAEGSSVSNGYEFQTLKIRWAAQHLHAAVLVALEEVRSR